MGVNIPCVEKFDPSREPSVVDAKWDRYKKSFKIYHVSDWLGKRAKGSVASLWRTGTAGRIFQTFDEQFVAVDDVWPTVSQ